MRFLVKATIPVEAGNALVRDPSFGKVMQDILSDLKPEAVYYCAEHGQRTTILSWTSRRPTRYPRSPSRSGYL